MVSNQETSHRKTTTISLWRLFSLVAALLFAGQICHLQFHLHGQTHRHHGEHDAGSLGHEPGSSDNLVHLPLDADEHGSHSASNHDLILLAKRQASNGISPFLAPQIDLPSAEIKAGWAVVSIEPVGNCGKSPPGTTVTRAPPLA